MEDKYFVGEKWPEPVKYDEDWLNEQANELRRSIKYKSVEVHQQWVYNGDDVQLPCLLIKELDSIHYHEPVISSEVRWHISGNVKKIGHMDMLRKEEVLECDPKNMIANLYIHPEGDPSLFIWLGDFKVLAKYINEDKIQCLLLERMVHFSERITKHNN